MALVWLPLLGAAALGGGPGGGGGAGAGAGGGLDALLAAADSLGAGGGEGQGGAMLAAAPTGDAGSEDERRRLQRRPTLYSGSQSMTSLPQPIITANGRFVVDLRGGSDAYSEELMAVHPGSGLFVDVVNVTVLNPVTDPMDGGEPVRSPLRRVCPRPRSVPLVLNRRLRRSGRTPRCRRRTTRSRCARS